MEQWERTYTQACAYACINAQQDAQCTPNSNRRDDAALRHAAAKTTYHVASLKTAESTDTRSVGATTTQSCCTDARTLTLCCVGLVFCSPTEPTTGTRDRWRNAVSSAGSRCRSCRNASRNTNDSMSPTVPSGGDDNMQMPDT